MRVSRIGEWNGSSVDEARLVSEGGVEVAIMNFGVVVRDWRVPVEGRPRPVVLGFDTFEPYPAHSPYFGAIAGRIANRVGGARFALDGVIHELTPNEGGNQLHGGPDGLSFQVWEMEPDSSGNRVRFSHRSPDGAMGYPGTVDFEAIYGLTGNRLSLELRAVPDRPTPVSLVQHHYFNLGTGPDVLDHRVKADVTHYTPLDGALIPTGEIRPVEGTIYDLRKSRTLRSQSGAPIDYDINLVLRADRDQSRPAASVAGPDNALTLNLFTDQPGLQFYDSVTTNVPVPGHGGRIAGPYSGLCLEDQAFPDAVNHSGFPSVIVTPDRPYFHHCGIEIG